MRPRRVVRGLGNLGHQAEFIWHDSTSLGNFDAVILPGGFSYGDYLRCGAIAKFSPVMAAVKKFAQEGGLVLGICNGFQILVESGLLPGALLRNRDLRFVCRPVTVRVETTNTPFTCAATKGQLIKVPVAHGEGCYFADPRTLERWKPRIAWCCATSTTPTARCATSPASAARAAT